MALYMIRIFLFLAFSILSLQAHVFPSNAKLKFHNDHAILNVEIPENDLYLWMGTEDFPDKKEEQESLLKVFSNKYFQILSDGENLQAELLHHELIKKEFEYFRQGKSEIEVHHFHSFKFKYPLKTEIKDLEIIPPHDQNQANGNQSFRSIVNIQMELELVGKGFLKNFYLTQLTYFVLNKEKPYESELYHIYDGEKEEPGTDSRWFSSLNGFINISNYQVSQDLLFPLDYFVDQVGLEYDEEIVDLEFQKLLVTKVAKFVKDNFSIKINGEERIDGMLKPHLTTNDLNQLVHHTDLKEVEYVFYDSLLGISLTRNSKEKIHSVEWTVSDKLLNKYIKRYNLYTRFPNKTKEAYELDQSNNSYKWKREKASDSLNFSVETPKVLFLKIPILSFLFIPFSMIFFALYLLKKKTFYLAGAALSAANAVAFVFISVYTIPSPFKTKVELNEEQAKDITEKLLQHTYSCFERRDEHDLYNALIQSVQEESSQDIYLTIQEQIKEAEQGGPQVEINDTQLLEHKILEQGYNTDKLQYEFTIKAKWQVEGSIVHWGHGHEKTKIYTGTIKIAAKEKSSWKILSYEVESLEDKD